MVDEDGNVVEQIDEGHDGEEEYEGMAEEQEEGQDDDGEEQELTPEE